MPIIAKHILEARRAAAQEAARSLRPPSSEKALQVQARTRTRAHPDQVVVPPATSPATTSDHADMAEPGRERSRADYPIGYKRPPEHTRFKKGCKAGPGRPKGSLNHDTLLKRQLDLKERVRVNGREIRLSRREVVLTKTVMAAIEGKDRDARQYVLRESARLYAPADQSAPAGPAPVELNASDALSMEEYEADLRARLLAELGLDPAAKEDDR